jgi:hypothetical protein
MAVSIKNTVFWGVAMCGLVDAYQHSKIMFSTLKMEVRSSFGTLLSGSVSPGFRKMYGDYKRFRALTTLNIELR